MNLKKSRFEHVLRVKEQAELLAKAHGIDIEKAGLAALLHDCAKGNEEYYSERFPMEIENLAKQVRHPDLLNPKLIHGLIGSIVAKYEYGVKDESVLDAILYHSTGHVGMTDLTKIIFLADKTEKKRDYDQVDEIRRLAFLDLDKAICKSLDQTILFLIKKKQMISVESVRVRNSIIIKE